MTTPVGHSLIGLIVFLITPHSGRREALVIFVIMMIAALAADVDLFPMLWGDLTTAKALHQHITHSLAFTALAGLFLAFLAARITKRAFLGLLPFFVAASWSHLLLDYFTLDTREPVGIMLLWPFSDARFNSSFPLFGGFSKSSFGDIFSWQNAGVVLGEIAVLAPVVIVVWLLYLYFNRRSRFGGADV